MQLVEPAERVVLDRGARVAERSQSGNFRDRRTLLARIVVVACTTFARTASFRSASRAASGKRLRRAFRHDARTSARCTARTGEPRRRRPPPMWSRQEASHAHTASAPLARTLSSFAASIAAETSSFLTAKVPPNPQHSSAPPAAGARGRRRPRRRSGRSPRRRSRSEWQGGVIGDGAAETASRWSRRPRRRGTATAPTSDPRQRRLRPTRGGGPHVRRAGPRRRHDRVVGAEDVDEPPCERPRLGEVARIEVQLSAAGLLGREVDLDPRSPEDAIVAFPTSGAIAKSARHVTKRATLKRFKPRQAASAVSTARSRRFVVKTILCYGDSNTWGCILSPRSGSGPGGCPRTSAGRGASPGARRGPLGRRAGAQRAHDRLGRSARAVPERRGIAPTLLTHQPVDLVILMLGTNDVKRRFDVGAGEIAAGAGSCSISSPPASAGRSSRLRGLSSSARRRLGGSTRSKAPPRSRARSLLSTQPSRTSEARPSWTAAPR